jgi:hypothetical protein
VNRTTTGDDRGPSRPAPTERPPWCHDDATHAERTRFITPRIVGLASRAIQNRHRSTGLPTGSIGRNSRGS